MKIRDRFGFSNSTLKLWHKELIWNLHIVPTDIYVSYLCFILLVYHTRIVEISNVPTYSDDPNKSSELFRGVGTGEARASLEFRGFSTEKFLTSWIYEGGNFSCFTGKKLVPTPLTMTKWKHSKTCLCFITVVRFGDLLKGWI